MTAESTPALLAVAASAATGLVWAGAGAEAVARARRLGGATTGARPSTPPRRPRLPKATLGAIIVGAVILGAVVAFVAFPSVGPGPAGWLASSVVALLWVSRRRGHRARRRLARHAASQVPRAADLLAGCLDAGAESVEALEITAAALGPPLGASLRDLAGAARLGLDPAAPARLPPDAAELPIARALARASLTGAPLADGLRLLAEEHRRDLRWTREAAARRAGVHVVGPLMLCFLPAFVVLGVVPVVLSVAAEVVGSVP